MRGRSAVSPSPVFLAIVAATIVFGLMTWRYGGTIETKFSLSRVSVFGFVLAAWVLSLCLHEFGHAYLAYKSGDHSVATRGYLTLNPMKYGDVTLSFLIPVLFILLGGIGLPGGAVWIDRHVIPGRIRHSLISAAGPLSNVIFAVMLVAVYRNFASAEHGVFWFAMAFLIYLQVTAAILNLLPIPGLDGFGILEPYLPRRWVDQANQYGGYIFLALIALLWVKPINEAFFNVVHNVTDALGVSEMAIQVGLGLFRFWSD
ncbi:site-2 protease family protein [Spirillospora sp. NPDC047279]|uniref:site-2 protease family protein n=1 Tax=Spirillospora sp. NPDC047279 TaxID=3155478 RepID=UPI0033CDC41F